MASNGSAAPLDEEVEVAKADATQVTIGYYKRSATFFLHNQGDSIAFLPFLAFSATFFCTSVLLLYVLPLLGSYSDSEIYHATYHTRVPASASHGSEVR